LYGNAWDFYFRIHCQNIHYEHVIAFVTWLHRQLGRKFIWVLDRYSAHRKAASGHDFAGEHTCADAMDWFILPVCRTGVVIALFNLTNINNMLADR